MIEKVIKRDGKVQQYCFDKVCAAVSEAFKSCGKEPPEKFIEQLKEEIESKFEGSATVEDIQDEIRNFLIKKNKYDVVDSFILYRDKRNRIREQKSKLIKGIKDKLDAKNVQNQNANVDEKSFGGRIGEASRVVTKELALNNCMSEKSRNNHLNNENYIHDLDSYAVGMHNCLSIPFDELLKNGFKTRQTDVRPANSINTAMQLVAVIFQLQSLQQFGGVSATHLDWTMVPYVRKSFYKHFTDGLKYVEGLSDEEIEKFNKELENSDI
jgi:ribonucleoside-triphosphate reductase (formate)